MAATWLSDDWLLLRGISVWVRGFTRWCFSRFPSTHGMSERVPFASRSKRNQKFAPESNLFPVAS